MRQQIKTMQPLEMDIDQNGDKKTIKIQMERGVFEVIHNGQIIGALKPLGEDWQLLDYEQIADQVPLFEIDLEPNTKKFELHAPIINQIIGEVENHYK